MMGNLQSIGVASNLLAQKCRVEFCKKGYLCGDTLTARPFIEIKIMRKQQAHKSYCHFE